MFVLIMSICLATKCANVEISQPFKTYQNCYDTGAYSITSNKRPTANVGARVWTYVPEQHNFNDEAFKLPNGRMLNDDQITNLYVGTINWFYCLERKE